MTINNKKLIEMNLRAPLKSQHFSYNTPDFRAFITAIGFKTLEIISKVISIISFAISMNLNVTI